MRIIGVQIRIINDENELEDIINTFFQAVWRLFGKPELGYAGDPKGN